MTFLDTIDPELREPFTEFASLFAQDWAPLDVQARRELVQLPTVASAGRDQATGVVWDEQLAVSRAGGPLVPVRVYRPGGGEDSRPAALFIHGGGLWAGSVDSEHPQVIALVAQTGMVVVSVDYRLAPEHQYPAALDDTHTAYQWMIDQRGPLGIDVDRVALIGGSAGGGLAVATAFRVRDAGGTQPAFLLAMYPMLDNANDNPSTYQQLPFPLWNRRANEEGWRWYLGDQVADGYASPSRAENVAGLPPTFLDVGDRDLFVDEVVTFAQRLRSAGVPTELHVYPGLFHAGEHMAPTARLSRQVVTNRVRALGRAFGIDRGTTGWDATRPAPVPTTVDMPLPDSVAQLS